MKTAHDLVIEAKSLTREVSIDDADSAIRAADFVIDVREPEEYHNGHIQGAVNIPRGMLEFELTNNPTLEPRQQSFVIYCKTSGRAALSALAMKTMGYSNVQSIGGGFDAWVEHNKPVITPSLPDFE